MGHEHLFSSVSLYPAYGVAGGGSRVGGEANVCMDDFPLLPPSLRLGCEEPFPARPHT